MAVKLHTTLIERWQHKLAAVVAMVFALPMMMGLLPFTLTFWNIHMEMRSGVYAILRWLGVFRVLTSTSAMVVITIAAIIMITPMLFRLLPIAFPALKILEI